jgi:GT2 family glycosyltransferase
MISRKVVDVNGIARHSQEEGRVIIQEVLPLVSIVTPAYNRAAYLAETIESVLTQDYPRMEYIVLDDGSTDNTREILVNYTGRLIWETHRNMGETRTVNKGLSMAHGEIVAVVNSDDPLLPGAVNAAVAFLQAHPDVLVAYPDWKHIGPNGETIQHVQVREYDYLYMLRRHHCTVGPGAFIRRRALELAGLRDPEFRYVGDFEFWLRAGLRGPFARIPLTLATFRRHPDSTSISSMGKAMAAEHIRLIENYYSTPHLPPEVRRVRREAFAWAHYVAGIASGPARWTARAHFLKSITYHPQSLLREWRLLVAVVLPRPVFEILRRIWQKGRLVLQKARRLIKRALGAVGEARH